MIKKGQGAQIRKRGNNYEVELAKEFRELGFLDTCTSRYESKRRDDAKVDLCFTEPFNVQAKCRNNYGNPLPTLSEMPSDDNINVIISKVVNRGEFVTMNKKDFYVFVAMLKNNSLI